MSLAYIDHQRTRFWRTHEEIYDFRKTRDTNWIELTTARKDREEERKGARETRRQKWEEERNAREKADADYLKHREEEREARSHARNTELQENSLSSYHSRRGEAWNRHVETRSNFRKNQENRLTEEEARIEQELKQQNKAKESIKERHALRAAREEAVERRMREDAQKRTKK